MIPIYTKESLIQKFREIKSMGWIPNARIGNSGGVGNTLEDLLGIKENNLPIPNAAEWELKCQRMRSNSLVTLFHLAIEEGDILIDFDARTGHNHGTKFRFRKNRLPSLYENILEIQL